MHVVDETNVDDPDAPTADALVTVLPGVVLMARAADCVPVVLADPDAGVVAAVHAGRPGLVAGVVTAALDAMQDLGARQVEAWLGPHVCGACYEVPEQMRAEVADVVPESSAVTSWDTPSIDIGAGVRAQLAHRGVAAHDVERCTIEDEDLYSYRRQGERVRAPRRPGVAATVSERRDAVARNLEQVRARIAAACERAGRSPSDVTLTVVTKFFPASDVDSCASSGCDTWGRTATRRRARRRRSARTSTSPGTSWAVCRATRLPR